MFTVSLLPGLLNRFLPICDGLFSFFQFSFVYNCGDSSCWAWLLLVILSLYITVAGLFMFNLLISEILRIQLIFSRLTFIVGRLPAFEIFKTTGTEWVIIFSRLTYTVGRLPAFEIFKTTGTEWVIIFSRLTYTVGRLTAFGIFKSTGTE